MFVPLADALKFLLHLSETQSAACLTGPGEDSDLWKFNVYALVAFMALVATLMTWTYGIGAPAGVLGIASEAEMSLEEAEIDLNALPSDY